MNPNRARRRTLAAGRFAGIAAGLVLALLGRVAMVQLGGEYHDDSANPFTHGMIDTDVAFPPLHTADGKLVASSAEVGGHHVRRYADGSLTALVGVMPLGGAPVGVEAVVADRAEENDPPLVLTVDSRIQAAAVEALEGVSGSVLVLDTSGAVLAAADTTTAPVAAPDAIADGRWTPPEGAFALWPRGAAPALFDRPVAAGSTLKPLIYAAAVDAGVVDLDERFPASRGYVPAGGRSIENFGGSLCPAGDLVDAIARSCNTTAVEVAERLGAPGLRAAFRSSGFGPAPAPGMAASVAAVLDGWPATADETSLATIGQGESRVTLLGLGLAYAGLARGSAPPLPRLFATDPVTTTDVEPFGPEGRAAALEGMRASADHGTAHDLGDFDVAAKTGTATRSSRGDSDGWAVALYPATDPRYVVVVRVDGADRSAGGSDAVAVTRALLPTVLPLFEN